MSTQISNKKLKAIVFTDIVNFTQLSSKDEQHALELIDKQREIVRPIVEKHSGEWLKEIGDGLLFSFDSSLDAVNCSIEIQQNLKDIDDFKIRIGIHQGDVFIKDGDVFGDDVNIASRVENFAPEGGIAISDKISKDVSGVKNIKTSFIGHRKLKGVHQETKVSCISSHNLPKHNLSRLPVIAAYICFFWAALSFITTILYPISMIFQKYAHAESASSPVSLIWIQQVTWVSIVAFIVGLIHLLIGYSTLSFSRGLSNKSQRFLVYLSYVFIGLPFILFVFNPNQQKTFKEIAQHGTTMILVFILILVVIPSIIAFIFKRIFSKKVN